MSHKLTPQTDSGALLPSIEERFTFCDSGNCPELVSLGTKEGKTVYGFAEIVDGQLVGSPFVVGDESAARSLASRLNTHFETGR